MRERRAWRPAQAERRSAWWRRDSRVSSTVEKGKELSLQSYRDGDSSGLAIAVQHTRMYRRGYRELVDGRGSSQRRFRGFGRLVGSLGCWASGVPSQEGILAQSNLVCATTISSRGRTRGGRDRNRSERAWEVHSGGDRGNEQELERSRPVCSGEVHLFTRIGRGDDDGG
jgi:hypothetical protein